MNEDLHDIDKLFRDGLDGHLEELPPSVWEEVSHDLDKKQVAHFRDKYYRLKRLVLLFLLVAFVSGLGIVYYEFSKKDTGSASVTSSPSKTINIKDSQPLPDVPGRKKISEEEKPGDSSTTDEFIVNNNGSKENAIVNNGNPDKRLDKQDNNDKTSVDITANKNLPSVDDSKGVIAKHTNKIIVNKAHHISSNSSSKKENAVVVKSEYNKGFQTNTTNRFTNYKRVNGDPVITNRSTNTIPLNEIPTNVNKALVQKNAPLAQAISPYKKIEMEAHYNYPTIDLKQQSAERKNVVPPAINKKMAGSKSSSHSFYLTGFFAPAFSFDRLEDDDHLAGPGRDRNEFRKDESSTSSLSGGLLLSYSLTNKVALQTGLTISSTSTGIAPKTLYARPDNNGRPGYELHCSSGYSYITPKSGAQPTVGDSVSITGSTSKLNYLSVPLSVSLTLQKGRFSLHPTIGIGANFLTSGRTETPLPGSESAVASITGLRSVYMDGRIGIGAEYGLSKKLSLSIKPLARLALTPINQQTPVKSYQNYLSIETGIKIKL